MLAVCDASRFRSRGEAPFKLPATVIIFVSKLFCLLRIIRFAGHGERADLLNHVPGNVSNTQREAKHSSSPGLIRRLRQQKESDTGHWVVFKGWCVALWAVLHVWRWFLSSWTDGKSTLNVHVDDGSHLHWFHQKTTSLLPQKQDSVDESPALVHQVSNESRTSITESLSEFFDAQEVLLSASSSENEVSDGSKAVGRHRQLPSSVRKTTGMVQRRCCGMLLMKLWLLLLAPPQQAGCWNVVS